MALTTAQQALLLFKKWLGLGQTTSSREFFNETAYPGRVAVYTNQIWTQADLIPNTAPVLTNGQTSGVVQYWQNAPLGAVPGTTNAFTSSLLIDAIPFNYGDGSSYNYVIRNNVGATIAFGEGDWIVDTDAGLVTFYSTVPSNMPPNISFYKYVGAKGFTSASVTLTGSLFGTSSWATNAVNAQTVPYSGLTGIPSGILSSSTQINNLTDVSSSFATTASAATSITFVPETASFAISASWAPTLPNIVSSSTQINTGSFSGSFIGTASFASFVEGGKANYIPIWWSSSNALSSSIMYQTGKGIFIGYDTAPHLHSTEGETLAVHSGETGVKNVIYAHGTSNDSYRVNIRNISNGVSASTNFIATTDNGNDLGGYVRLGINSSTYTRTDEIGGALDAYLFTTGSDLLIGTLSPDKRIILFTGPGNATNNARVYIDATGSVAINTSTTDPVNPEALLVTAIANSYNLIVGEANLDNYSQLNITNLNGGVSASADVVATANNGTETSNYIDMGINSDQYGITNAVGGPNDAYVYSTGNMLHIGNATPGQHIMFFAGGLDAEANNKLTLDANNQHILSGSLNVTGSISVQDNVINNLTASHAMTASYVAGAASDWNTLANKPEGLVSNSAQYPGWVTASSQIDYNLIQNKLSGAVSSAAQIQLLLPDGTVSSSTQYPGWVTASSQIQLNAITGTSFSNNAFYFPSDLRVEGVLTAQQINTEYVSSSIIYESGSSKFGDTFDDVMSVTGSIFVLGGVISGSMVGMFSSSAQVDYNQIQNKLSGVVSSSAQIAPLLPIGTVSSSAQYPGWVTASSQIDYNQIQNKLSGVISSSTQFNALSGTSASFATTASAANSITFTPSTASFATTASAATSITFIPTTASFATTASAATSITFTPNTASFATTASFAQNARLLNNTSSVVFATTGSNVYTGDQTISGSLLLNSDTVVFSGSFTTSGSFAISGSLGVTRGITGSLFGSSSFATTASAATSITFIPTTASFATTASAATSITFTPPTASFATTASFARSASFATTASAATSITFTPLTASFATTSSFSQNTQLLNNTGSGVFATTGSNTFNGTQTITGSLLTTTDIVIFSGSFTTTGSFAITGSLGVTAGITGSLLGSSSFATTASAATSITFIPSTASFATTASAATSITFTPISASFATTASAATSITFTPSSASFSTTSSFATTASAATSITFIPSSASFATTASAATSITFTPTSASFATTSSYAVTSSLAISASFIDGGFY